MRKLYLLLLVGFLVELSLFAKGFYRLNTNFTVADEQFVSCQPWICTDPPDSRPLEQYLVECQPVEVYYRGVYSYWCRDASRPEDRGQGIPAGGVIVED